MRIHRPKLSYSNAIATLALFVALGGVAVAAGLPRNSVGTKQLKRGAVTASDLRRESVTSGKIAPQAITSAELSPSSVFGEDLVNGAVTAETLANGSVTRAKLAAGAFRMPDTLPSGETERGTFMLGGNTTLDEDAISFPIPLSAPPQVTVLPIGTAAPGCVGYFPGNQTKVEASPGHLCIYVALERGKNPVLQDVYTTNLGTGLKATFSEVDPENLTFGFWTVVAP